MTYDYLEAVKDDIREWIEEHVPDVEEYTPDGLKNYLEERLWVEDSVTGNASGSYTFNRWTAQEYVEANPDLVRDMANEGWFDKDTLWEKFVNMEYEYLDVSIRCFLLYRAIDEVVDELS